MVFRDWPQVTSDLHQQKDLLTYKVLLYVKYGKYHYFLSSHIDLTRFWKIDIQWLRWPLTSTKMESSNHYNTSTCKYEKYPCSLSWDFMLTKFQEFTSGDPRWTLTSTKNTRIALLTWAIHIPCIKTVVSFLFISC